MNVTCTEPIIGLSADGLRAPVRARARARASLQLSEIFFLNPKQQVKCRPVSARRQTKTLCNIQNRQRCKRFPKNGFQQEAIFLVPAQKSEIVNS